MEKENTRKQTAIEDIDGVPSAEEQPLVFMPRYKQPISGIIALIFVFILSLITWWIFFDSRWHNPHLVHYASLIGGFGLLGVVWAIWFENWPYYKRFKKPWKIGIIGTIINLAIALIFTFLLLPLFNMFYGPSLQNTDPDPFVSWYIGASIFGSLSGSGFSFAVLILAGSMYWPVFKLKQPKRGIILWVLGAIITIIVWFLLFFPTGNPSAYAGDPASAVKTQYSYSLGWTQWLIFFSLLTQLVFEYWPWSSLATKQPYIGILCFLFCAIMGFIVSFIFPFIVSVTFDPIFQASGGYFESGLDQFKGWYVMSITYAIFLILAIVIENMYLDNWPKKYSQAKNLIFRFFIVLALGTAMFFGYYFLAPYLVGDPVGEPANYYWDINPTAFLLWFLWIELLYAYIWKNWPIYKVYR